MLGLLPFFGCGGDDDVTLSEGFRTSSEGFRFPSGTSGPLSCATPKETYNKYYHAQLLKQFGDIPEVRYLIAYSLHPGDKTREQIIAKSEVHYRLFPNEETLKSLQQTIALPDFTNPGPAETEDEWIQRDPEGYYEYLLEVFIKDYGDIPEVYTLARLTLKIKQDKNLTAAERSAYKDAVAYLRNLDAQREAEQDEGPDN